MIRMIAACSSNGVIGVNNSIPFHYSEDLKHFKKCTINGTVIMGRKTFESIGSKILPNRRNIVITTSDIKVENYTSLDQALQAAHEEENIWIIGGASVYQAGMQVADEIVLTVTPDIILQENCVKFPWINPLKFKINKTDPLGDRGLSIVEYIKI